MNGATATSRYPAILEDMAAKLAASLIDEGITPERAQAIAFRHAEFVRRDWGGGTVYIPLGASHNADEMARAIFSRWDRNNTRELLRELGISEGRLRQLYRIGKRLAAAERGSQGDDDGQLDLGIDLPRDD